MPDIWLGGPLVDAGGNDNMGSSFDSLPIDLSLHDGLSLTIEVNSDDHDGVIEFVYSNRLGLAVANWGIQRLKRSDNGVEVTQLVVAPGSTFFFTGSLQKVGRFCKLNYTRTAGDGQINASVHLIGKRSLAL